MKHCEDCPCYFCVWNSNLRCWKIERIRFYAVHLLVREIAPFCYVILRSMFQLIIFGQLYRLSRAFDSLSQLRRILDHSSILVPVLNCLIAHHFSLLLANYPGSHASRSSHWPYCTHHLFHWVLDWCSLFTYLLCHGLQTFNHCKLSGLRFLMFQSILVSYYAQMSLYYLYLSLSLTYLA